VSRYLALGIAAALAMPACTRYEVRVRDVHAIMVTGRDGPRLEPGCAAAEAVLESRPNLIGSPIDMVARRATDGSITVTVGGSDPAWLLTPSGAIVELNRPRMDSEWLYGHKEIQDRLRWHMTIVTPRSNVIEVVEQTGPLPGRTTAFAVITAIGSAALISGTLLVVSGVTSSGDHASRIRAGAILGGMGLLIDVLGLYGLLVPTRETRIYP
jgi:hypothetical protein